MRAPAAGSSTTKCVRSWGPPPSYCAKPSGNYWTGAIWSNCPNPEMVGLFMGCGLAPSATATMRRLNMPMPEFEPTAEQRESVSCLAAGGHLTVEQIAKTVINPRTQKPVSPRTLTRIFHKELGRHTDLQALVIKRYTEAVDRGEPWAVKLGMEFIVGIKNEETKAANTATENNNKGIKYIHFVHSPYRDEPIPGAYDLGPSEYRALAPPTGYISNIPPESI